MMATAKLNDCASNRVANKQATSKLLPTMDIISHKITMYNTVLVNADSNSLKDKCWLRACENHQHTSFVRTVFSR